MISEITGHDPKKKKCRLFCPLDQYKTMTKLFFSLVDYRNNYFTSDDPNKIIDFYNGFENQDQLIQWMKERPKGVANIYEVHGEKDIIVVIPTADFDGRYAMECRDNIFKGLHIVFVESGGKDDPYFNIGYNLNKGIKRASYYNPKWIVVSNDDMYRIDDIYVLKEALREVDSTQYKVVFTKPASYHSIPCSMSKQRVTRKVLFHLLGKIRREQLYLENRFGVEYFLPPVNGYWKLFFNKGPKILSIATFGAFSAELIRELGELYNETYLNSAEDMDLSVRLAFKKVPAMIIGYKIGNLKGSTLGRNVNRHLREIAGLSYFNLVLKLALLNN